MTLVDAIRKMYLGEAKDSPPFDVSKADYAGAAKELTQYAKKSGGIDKNDFLGFANRLSAVAGKSSPRVTSKFARDLQDLDTDVREVVIRIMRKNGIKVTMAGGGLKIEELTIEELEELDEAVNMDRVQDTYRSILKGVRNRGPADDDEVGDYIGKGWSKANIAALIKMLAKQGYDAKFLTKDLAPLAEAKRNPSKSGGSGYDLYHKDFSSAMQHAYKYAKDKLGITIDPKEIDDKVASGPRKPSSGKTNTYRLKGDKGSVQIQVANLDNKKYELNMYKEEVELDEAYKTPSEAKAYEDGKKAVAKGVSYDDNPNKKGTKEYTAWSKGHNDARARKIARKEEVEMENIEEAEFFKWEVKVGGRSWKGTARNAGEAVKKARPSMGNLDLSKASVTRIKEDVEMEEKKLTLEEAVMMSVFGEAKKDEKKDKKAPETDKDDDGDGMDPVDKKALKKDYDDRAKDGDGDLDNDGDEDKTDKYLHKKRQAVSKAIASKKKGPKSNGKSEPVDTTPTVDEEMSDAQQRKRDEIMKGLERKKGEFESKYGDRATEVMARTATKMAMKTEVKYYGNPNADDEKRNRERRRRLAKGQHNTYTGDSDHAKPVKKPQA